MKATLQCVVEKEGRGESSGDWKVLGVAGNPENLIRHYWISSRRNGCERLVLPASLSNPAGLGSSQLDRCCAISLAACMTLSVLYCGMHPESGPLDQVL